MKLALFACLWLLTSLKLLGQSESTWQVAEREKLLQGITALPKLGVPGPVAIWGKEAFPVIAGEVTGGYHLALCAASKFGRGRVVIYGHNSYLSGEGEVGKLLRNAISWCSGVNKPKVGIKRISEKELTNLNHLNIQKIDGELDEKTLKQFDVVIANVQGVTSEKEAKAVQQYVNDGGGFIAGMTGWAFGQTSGGKSLIQSHYLNHALANMGVTFTEESNFNRKLTGFDAKTELSELLNAHVALEAMHKQKQGVARLTSPQMQQIAGSIQLAAAAQPPSHREFLNLVFKVLGDGGGSLLPSAQQPLNQTEHAEERIRLGMQARMLKQVSGENLQAHPAAKVFPGIAPANARRVDKSVKVDPKVPGWTSTGLWVNAGDQLQVEVPDEIAGKGYSLRIGCHTDTLYHLDAWKRVPEITRKEAIETKVIRSSSAFGGLVYIEVPDKAEGESFEVKITGGIEAPFFVLGQHTDVEWNNKLKHHPAPWAEMACENLIITCPTENMRMVTNPTQLMSFWKEVVAAQDDICDQARERIRPERIVADVQISAGYMHSGYPIMIPTSASDEMVTYNRLRFPGWGFYHEIGHNHQRKYFTFDGSVEVTNNVIAMWCYHAVLKKDWLIGHTAITEEARRGHVAKIKSSTNKWETWKSSPFLALTTYIQLLQKFGWESWRSYLYSFNDPSYGPLPKTDDEARDQFLIRYSKIVKADLGPFFDAWGIPVSKAAKAEASKQGGAWLPDEMK